MELALAGAATWAIGSNAKQHEFVRQTVEVRYTSEAKSDFGYVLRRILFRSSSKIIERASGTHFDLIFSKTADRSAFKKYAQSNREDGLGNLDRKPPVSAADLCGDGVVRGDVHCLYGYG